MKKELYEMPEATVLILSEEREICTSVETENVSVGYNGFNDEQEW